MPDSHRTLTLTLKYCLMHFYQSIHTVWACSTLTIKSKDILLGAMSLSVSVSGRCESYFLLSRAQIIAKSVKGPIHDSDLQSQPRFPTATSTKFPVYGLQQPQPPPWLADRCCGCCWSEFSDIWWAELKVAVEVAVVYGQKRPDLVSCASKNNAIFARSSESRSDIVENCHSTEKDWTDRSLRVWVDHQQQSQPRSGCTSRLRLKIAVVDGALKKGQRELERQVWIHELLWAERAVWIRPKMGYLP